MTNEDDDKLPEFMPKAVENAMVLHEIFVSFLAAGFTEAQALTLIAQLISNTIGD